VLTRYTALFNCGSCDDFCYLGRHTKNPDNDADDDDGGDGGDDDDDDDDDDDFPQTAKCNGFEYLSCTERNLQRSESTIARAGPQKGALYHPP